MARSTIAKRVDFILHFYDTSSTNPVNPLLDAFHE